MRTAVSVQGSDISISGSTNQIGWRFMIKACEVSNDACFQCRLRLAHCSNDLHRPAGTVLVTFKSHQSVPPYRIENQCSDVYIYFVQACLAGERPGRWNWLQPRTNGNALAYAWDEPSEDHLLRVKVLASPHHMEHLYACHLIG